MINPNSRVNSNTSVIKLIIEEEKMGIEIFNLISLLNSQMTAGKLRLKTKTKTKTKKKLRSIKWLKLTSLYMA